MFCRKCGAVLPDGSAFCPKCGTPVSGAPQGTGVNNSCMGTGIGSRLLSLSSWFSGKGRMARKESGSGICSCFVPGIFCFYRFG